MEHDETFDEFSEEEQIDHDHDQIKILKRKKRLFRLIIFFIVLLIIFGIIANLIMVYLAASSVEVVDERLNKVKAITVENYEITFTLTLENPTDTAIQIDRITYDAYLEDSYLGNGAKNDLTIEPGAADYIFTFTFNIFDLSDAARQHLLSDSATLKINGEVTIPVKFMGSLEFMKITLPYEITEEISRA